MEYFLPLAVKSLLIAGGTLLLLKLMHKRSSSDRSWVAHLGLLAILLLPLAAITLPALQVAGPSFLATDTTPNELPPVTAPTETVAEPEVAPAASSFPEEAGFVGGSAVDWAFWGYAGPASLLLLLTLIALGRLSVLKGRANVLVDAHWLQALARAQQRMGFKNGTALLTSNELKSPISWGLMRPVILLNTDATNAKDEAEAIIAHELAHVAGFDWAKLMLSRVTVALFWFNPLVWLLAREAHQLREEAADDAVLAANIEDTEYANLLVGIARHECRGMLLGAHGVAPGKGSLTRRVKRVLDAALDRAPGGWKWSSAAAFFAAGMTVPVAALQFVAPTTASAAESDRLVAGVAEPERRWGAIPGIDPPFPGHPAAVDVSRQHGKETGRLERDVAATLRRIERERDVAGIGSEPDRRQDLGHGEEHGRAGHDAHLIVAAHEGPHAGENTVDGHAPDSDDSGAEEIGVGGGGGTDAEAVTEGIEGDGKLAEYRRGVAPGTDAGVAVTDEGGKALKLDDDLGAGGVRQGLLDAGEGTVELPGSHRVIEVRVVRGRLGANDGEVFTPFADPRGIECRGLLEDQGKEGEGHAGVRLRQPGNGCRRSPCRCTLDPSLRSG